MADRKITELNALTGANATDTDVFAIVDISADETKKMTLAELKNAFDTGSGFVRITGDTMTGDLTVPNVVVSGTVDGVDIAARDAVLTSTTTTAGAALPKSGGTMTGTTAHGDGVASTFGDSADLTISHAGGSTYLTNTTGSLILRTDSFRVLNTANSEQILHGTADGSVVAYHNNAEKLATTATGIDVTGTVTADGLTVDGSAVINNAGSIGYGGNLVLTLNDTANDYPMLRFTGTSGGLFAIRSEGTNSLKFYEDTGSSLLSRMYIAEGGDISFYEDTGTTAKMVWKSADERLGVGTSLPTTKLQSKGGSISTPTNNAGLIANASASFVVDHGNDYGIYTGYVAAANDAIGIAATRTGGAALPLSLQPFGGNVGIGTSSPTGVTGYKSLDIGAGSVGSFIEMDSTSGMYHRFVNNNGQLLIQADAGNTAANSGVIFDVDASEAMRIDQSGSVLVGTTTTDGGYDESDGGATVVFQGASIGGAASGTAFVSRRAAPLQLNRQANDGDIAVFRKDGTTVGTIGSRNSESLMIGSTYGTEAHLNFGNGAVFPVTNSGIVKDSQITLGASTARFKDLYLSGGVYLGGTGAANKLDDYEEGTWTPQIYYQNATDQAAATNVIQSGRYTKVGNLVNVSFRLEWTAGASVATDNIGVKNLPFVGADNHYNSTGTFFGSYSGSLPVTIGNISAGGSLALVLDTGNGGNLGPQFGTGSGRYIRGSITYLAQ